MFPPCRLPLNLPLRLEPPRLELPCITYLMLSQLNKNNTSFQHLNLIPCPSRLSSTLFPAISDNSLISRLDST